MYLNDCNLIWLTVPNVLGLQTNYLLCKLAIQGCPKVHSSVLFSLAHTLMVSDEVEIMMYADDIVLFTHMKGSYKRLWIK